MAFGTVKVDSITSSTQTLTVDSLAKTDTSQVFTAAQRGTITTLTSGATVTPNFAASNNYSLTLDQNLTIANPSNLTAGQSGSIFLVQDVLDHVRLVGVLIGTLLVALHRL